MVCLSLRGSNIHRQKTISQLFRYGLIGIAGNLLGYLAYLLITYFGGSPKLTMSLLYGIIATAGFFCNRKLTFSHTGSSLGAGVRYIIAHCAGYIINLVILIVMVDNLGYPHQWIQVMAILLVAAFLFLAFKFYVFKDSAAINVVDE